MRERKLNRLKGYDYSKNGYYFVTMNIKDGEHYFGEVVDGEMAFSEYGEIVKKQWLWLEDQYYYVKLDEFVIMPDHFHGIIIIERECVVGNSRDCSVREPNSKVKIKSLSQLVGAFKTTSSKLIRKSGLSNFQWHKSFHDRIIRNDGELDKIREYIRDNPLKRERRERSRPFRTEE